MTAIAAVRENGKVWIGGDSAGVAGLDLTPRADAKVFLNGPFAFGFTSSYRMGQLLRFSLKPPEQAKNTDDFAFMATGFIDAVRQCLKDGGYASKTNENESGGTFIVGYKGEIYCVEEDYQIAGFQDSFHAVGCGYQIVRGSLYSTAELDMTPQQRIKLSLKAAERFSAGVRGPFSIVSI